MKARPDINDALRDDGPETVRDRADHAKKYQGNGHAEEPEPELVASVSWIMTEAIKARLQAIGFSDEEIKLVSRPQADEILDRYEPKIPDPEPEPQPEPEPPKPKSKGKGKLDLDDIIKNGGGNRWGGDRSRAVWWCICEAIRRGMTDDQILAFLLDRNNKISDHIYDHKQDPTTYAHRQIEQARSMPQGAGLEDTVALKFAAKHGHHLKYVAAWNKWLQWDGARWQFEDTLHAFHLSRQLCREAKDGRHKIVAAVIGLARTDRSLAATVDQWDADPWLLGTIGGTIDLHTGKLFHSKSSDYLTRIVRTTPNRNCPIPLWRKFLKTVTNEDEELQKYLQRVSGYCLTGDTSEEALFFLHGPGQNGKGTFANTIADILGDYHETVPMETLVVIYGTQHPTDLASLRGARLATASETEEGRQWAEAKIKRLTGRDPIKARFMRQDFFEYMPQFKLLIESNHKPIIRSVDKAIRRRMNLIPFLVTIADEKKDKQLREKLKAEWPSILNWMIEGCLEWQRIALAPPQVVLDATNEYLESQDTLQTFLEDCCVVAKNESDSVEHLWDGWVDFTEDVKEPTGSKQRFLDRLRDRGFIPDREGKDRTRIYRGLRCIRENKKRMMEDLRLDQLKNPCSGSGGRDRWRDY
jgi:putative DNA primase/helicase